MTEKVDRKSFELFYDSWIIIKITENGIENLGTVKEFREKNVIML